jgi:hypothetical protein
MKRQDTLVKFHLNKCNLPLFIFLSGSQNARPGPISLFPGLRMPSIIDRMLPDPLLLDQL